MSIDDPSVIPTHPSNVELERLGDQIAELAAHLDAATARLLDLIREFDARGGRGNGFASCAHWLAWRVGLALGAAREHVRVARALGSLPRLRKRLPAVSCRTRRCGRSRVWRRRRPKSGCSRSAGPARPSTSS